MFKNFTLILLIMEYFSYDYSKINRDLKFTNYDNFITNMRIYKFYLFDLSLLTCDPITPKEKKNQARNILIRQKFLFILPYLIIFPTIYFYNKSYFFSSGALNKEINLIGKLFALVITIRIIQKALLKYEGDSLLIDIKMNKEYSI